jgi:hypothetical protein
MIEISAHYYAVAIKCQSVMLKKEMSDRQIKIVRVTYWVLISTVVAWAMFNSVMLAIFKQNQD